MSQDSNLGDASMQLFFDNYINRYAASNMIFSRLGSVPDQPTQLKSCILEDESYSFKKKVVAFDLGNVDILKLLRDVRDGTSLNNVYFSESTIIVPDSFKLMTGLVSPGDTIDKSMLQNMIDNAVPMSRGKYDLIHTVSNSSDVNHPCQTPPATAMMSSMGVLEEDGEKQHGAKACAYLLFTATALLSSSFILFYIDVSDPDVSFVLKKIYPSVNWNRVTRGLFSGYSEPAEDEWKNAFVIPLLISNNTIVYHIIPDTDTDTTTGSIGGRDYLINWIKESGACDWVAMDFSHEYIDKWGIYVTLDARMVKP